MSSTSAIHVFEQRVSEGGYCDFVVNHAKGIISVDDVLLRIRIYVNNSSCEKCLQKSLGVLASFWTQRAQECLTEAEQNTGHAAFSGHQRRSARHFSEAVQELNKIMNELTHETA